MSCCCAGAQRAGREHSQSNRLKLASGIRSEYRWWWARKMGLFWDCGFGVFSLLGLLAENELGIGQQVASNSIVHHSFTYCIITIIILIFFNYWIIFITTYESPYFYPSRYLPHFSGWGKVSKHLYGVWLLARFKLLPPIDSSILCCEKMYKYFLLLLPQEVLILSKNGWKTVENGDFITSTCGNLSLVIACQCTAWPHDWKRRWKGRFFSLPPTFPPVRIVELVEYPEYVERDILLGAENVKNMEIPLIPWNWLCSSKRVLEWAHTGMLCPVLENLPTCLMLR